MFNINMGEMGSKYKELLAMNMKHYQEFANFFQNSMPEEMKAQMQKFDFTPHIMKEQSEIFGDDFTVKAHQQFTAWKEQMQKAQDEMKKFNSDFASSTKKFSDELKAGYEKFGKEMTTWHEKMMSHHKGEKPIVDKEKHTQTK